MTFKRGEPLDPAQSGLFGLRKLHLGKFAFIQLVRLHKLRIHGVRDVKFVVELAFGRVDGGHHSVREWLGRKRAHKTARHRPLRKDLVRLLL